MPITERQKPSIKLLPPISTMDGHSFRQSERSGSSQLPKNFHSPLKGNRTFNKSGQKEFHSKVLAMRENLTLSKMRVRDGPQIAN